MAREIPYIQAIGEAIQLEMARDETVIYFGQNLALTEDDPYVKAFGSDRVRVTPISGDGVEIGTGRRGVRRLPTGRPAVHGRVHARRDGPGRERGPRFYGMSGGEVKVPLVLQAGYGFTAGWAGQHGTIYGMFMGVPGLKVVVPSTPADAKGLMTASIRDDNPVVFFHNYLMTLEHGDVPEGEHVVPLGEAVVRREGSDVTIVGIGWTVGKALAAAEQLAADGIERRWSTRGRSRHSTSPRSSSRWKTGRLVVVDQATRHASAAAVIAAEVASEGFSALKAPIGLVTALDATIPYSQPMEEYLMPSEEGSSPRCNRRSAPRPSPPERGRTAVGGARRGPRRRVPQRHVADPRVRGARQAAGRADEVHGLVHLSVGQEAVAVGVCGQLSDDDAVYSNHRAHGHAIAKGAPLGRVMAELMGRDGGLCRASAARCTSSTSSTASSARPASWAVMCRSHWERARGPPFGRDEVAVVFFGDGAVQGGIFVESVNLAALWALPVILVCEQRLRRVHPALGPHDRGTCHRRRRALRPRAHDGRRERRRRREGRLRPLPRGGAAGRGPVPARVPDAPPARPLRGRPAALARGRSHRRWQRLDPIRRLERRGTRAGSTGTTRRGSSRRRATRSRGGWLRARGPVPQQA